MNIQDTIWQVIDKNLDKYGLTWQDLKSGPLTQQKQDCTRDVVNASCLTSQMMLAQYTDISRSRVDTLING
jgi:hypothetical protein